MYFNYLYFNYFTTLPQTPNGSAKSFINSLHWSKSRNCDLKDWIKAYLAFPHKSLCQCPDSSVAVTGKCVIKCMKFSDATCCRNNCNFALNAAT